MLLQVEFLQMYTKPKHKLTNVKHYIKDADLKKKKLKMIYDMLPAV